MKPYQAFHDKCSEIESRFGRQGKLLLKHLDHSILNNPTNMLDFGAGKGLNRHLCKNYFTFDSDLSTNPSFSSIDAMQQAETRFDAIVANQVFEHIDRGQIQETVNSLFSVSKPGAILFATIPNVHRGSYFFNDIDHKTPLMYYHLAAFFELGGFDVVDAYRFTKRHDDVVTALKDPGVSAMVDFLQDMYELDFARFLVVVGRRRASPP